MERVDRRPEGPTGKLKEAARRWAYAHLGRADPDDTGLDDDIRRQAAALGVVLPPAAAEDDEGRGFPVWAENWPSVLAFLDCETQWRVVAAGLSGALIYFGLDYASVSALLAGRPDRDRVFADLRVMEGAALPILNKGDAA